VERRRFVVIGLGSFGHHLARSLYEMGHDVLAVDHEPAAVDAIQAHCSRAALADAADKEELEAAGVAGAEVGVVGLGTRIDASILATLFLKELGVKEIVAKAVSHDHGRILSRIGATEVIYPERDVALRLAQNLAEPDVLERIPFLEGYALVEIRAPSTLWGQSLAESRLRKDHRLSVALIKRRVSGEDTSVPARGDERIQKGDVLVVLAQPEDVEAFRKLHPR
jgi:trk system potassium uptake protein TrkA